MSKRSLFLFSIMAIFLGFGTNSFAETVQKPSDIPLKAFAQLRSNSGLRMSPDGTHMAYFLAYKGRQVIVISTIEGQPISYIPPAENAEISWFRWANDNRLVLSYAFTAERYGLKTRETRLYGVDRDGKNLKNLIKPRRKKGSMGRLSVEEVATQIQDAVIDWLPNDPDHILVSVDGDRDGRDEVRVVDVNDGGFKEIISGNRGIQNYRTDQQGEVRLGWGVNELNERKNMFKSPLINDWRSIEKTSWGDQGFDIIDFTEDPTIVYAVGHNDQGRKIIVKIDLESDQITETVFSHDKVDVDGLVTDPRSGKPIGVEYTIDQPEIIYFNNDLKSIQLSIDSALPKTINRIVGLQPEKKKYLIYSFSDVEPGVYYYLDMIEKKLKFIAETMPGIKPEDMSPMKAVSFKSRDGAEIPAYLTIPKGLDAKNLPVVVYVHGGPQSRDDQTFHYTVQFLASRGYAVLQPNFRGSTGYGKAFLDKGTQQWGGIMQDDVSDGTQWLIDQGIADPKRICIAGASYGGYAAAMGLIKTPDLFKCGISINAVLNMPGLIAGDKRYIGGKLWTETMGLEGADPETVSPYHQADKIKGPILIIHAKDDHRIDYDQAKDMHKKLKKLKKDVTLVTLEDGDHNLDTEAARTGELTAMEKFLKKHIGQ